MLRKILLGVAAVTSLGALALGGVAQAAPVYADTSVTADHQHVDAITAIDAAASWSTMVNSGYTAPTFLGNSITVVPVPTFMRAQLTAHGNFGTLTWTIVSETNIPAGVLIGLNPASGLLTVTPPGGPVIPANNQEITVVVKVTDGAATAFEALTAQPIIVSGVSNCQNENVSCIQAINVTAVTDAVTLAGVNNNVTGTVDFTSTPPGAAFTLANAPNGTALTGNRLAGTTAIPSTEDYNGVSVTATDAMGATAVDTFKLDVFGAIAANDTPRLSHGHAACGVNHSRMNVFYEQDGAASWDHFTIVGPGAINGHEGWVYGHLGLNEAVYGGLEAHHGYTVFYQPVTGQGSTTPVLGSHWGYVYFVSGQGC